MRNLITAVLFLSLSFLTHAQGKIDRIEPGFWWVNMNNTELQIMVHGKNIDQLNPTINYDGVVLQEVIKVSNPNYLFLNLQINPSAKAGNFDIDFYKKKKKVYSYNYELKERKAHSSERQGFDNSDVVYLITPDRFSNGDSSNDHVDGMYADTDRTLKDKRHGGDIRGIINELDYIEEMGFTGIWICPLLESNQKEYSYHGYAITDYYKIDPRYGTNEDYLELVEKANDKGIKIIMDQVANHNGKYHYWTNDLPTEDWYHQSDKMDDPQYTTHARTTLADPHAPASEKKAFSDGWFVDRMPDLNQSNPLLATYLIQNSIFWIEYAGLQGIRQDTYSYPDANFMNEWSKAIMEEYPNFNIVGEEWSYNPAIVARWQRGKVNADGFVSNAPSMMDFPNQEAIVNSLNKENENSWSSSFDDIYLMLSNDFLYADPSNLMTLLDNHDMPRIYDQLNQNNDLLEMALIFLYTNRGIPQIYYGTEILMSFPENPGDHGGLRIDMPGGWDGDPVNAFSGRGLTDEQKHTQEFIKRLNQLRTNHKVLQDGELYHYSPKDEVYVIFRVNEEETFVSIFNKNKESVTLDLSRFEELIQGAEHGIDYLTNTDYSIKQGSIEVSGTSALILQLK